MIATQPPINIMRDSTLKAEKLETKIKMSCGISRKINYVQTNKNYVTQ